MVSTCCFKWLAISSLLKDWSLSISICLNTLTGVGPSSAPTSSTSKKRVAPPGIMSPAPWSPYPSSGGTISLLFSPIHMPRTPSSHPLMTCPTPIWRNNQSSLLPNTHAKNTFLPSLDDLSNSNLELEWLTSVITGVKLLAVLQGSCVVHLQHISIPGNPITAVRLGDIFHLQS